LESYFYDDDVWNGKFTKRIVSSPIFTIFSRQEQRDEEEGQRERHRRRGGRLLQPLGFLFLGQTGKQQRGRVVKYQREIIIYLLYAIIRDGKGSKILN